MSPAPEDPPEPQRRLVLLAGASGSGKSRLTRLARAVDGGQIPTVSLDDFYHDHDHPGLPRMVGATSDDSGDAAGASTADTDGVVDWDHLDSWNSGAALATLHQLCRTGSAELPTYSIVESRRTGSHRVDAGAASTIVAEGIFASQMYARCRDAGMDVTAVWLDRPRTLTAVLRFVRDVREARKPLPVLLRRGLALWRAEPGVREAALEAGCRPLSFKAALGLIST